MGSVSAYLCICAFRSDYQIVCLKKYTQVQNVLLLYVRNKAKTQSTKSYQKKNILFCFLNILVIQKSTHVIMNLVCKGHFLLFSCFIFSFPYCTVQANCCFFFFNQSMYNDGRISENVASCQSTGDQTKFSSFLFLCFLHSEQCSGMNGTLCVKGRYQKLSICVYLIRSFCSALIQIAFREVN